MPPQFKQLPLSEMEFGLAKTLAVLDLSPKDISELTGVKFESAKDDLDYLQGALLLTPSGIQFSLRSYPRGPFPERTEIVGQEKSTTSLRDLVDFLNCLGVGAEHVIGSILDWGDKI